MGEPARTRPCESVDDNPVYYKNGKGVKHRLNHPTEYAEMECTPITSVVPESG